MSGREVEIHRGRLDNEILADRAQLLTQFLSKKIFKNFEKYRNTFSFFFDGNFENFRKISTFFIFEEENRGSFSKDQKQKSRDFPKNFKMSIQKNENIFRDFFKIFKNLF